MLGIALQARIRNTEIRRRTGVTNIAPRISTLKWQWGGRQGRKVLEWRPYIRQRSVGRANLVDRRPDELYWASLDTGDRGQHFVVKYKADLCPAQDSDRLNADLHLKFEDFLGN